jgi:hypothetical protein
VVGWGLARLTDLAVRGMANSPKGGTVVVSPH